MLFISSDHGGFKLKNKIVAYLRAKDIALQDLGPIELNENDDYPIYVAKLAEKMRNAAEAKGILICRNGVGVSMFANKFSFIRAALSWNGQHAASSRTDDDTNVLALPADYISEEDAMKIVDTWLATPFSGDERHGRRLAEMKDLLS